ncbi:hypothetical protein E1262_23490 [Jiangella aurantiaca]|uniref:Uncharacterized protein n=1 Tax=Jiangella aurantiaca TaxID=2530373 RepID=A0A4R5A2N0_9ACTN|nr:hypothetical protein [Jiangella aurantiaca]TDD66051.1 hypothetical protein E1262_23490 [Jiangella aurantiaca]
MTEQPTAALILTACLPTGLYLLYDAMWGNETGATTSLAQAPFGEPVDIVRAVLTLAAWTLALAALVRWRYGRADR